MTRFLPALLLLLSVSALSAQVQLTSNYFPQVGDTLRISVADSAYASSINVITEGGANLEWNFGTPVAAFNLSNAVETAVGNDSFPTADLKIRTNAFTESYYRVSDTEFNLVGISSSLAVLPDFAIVTPVLPERPTRRAPLNFNDTFSSVTENAATFSPDSIPPEALVLIGNALNAVDSVRITTISTRQDNVDAHGTVSIGGNLFEVLREKRDESVYIRLEVKTNPLPFIDVTNSISIVSPQLASLLGQQAPTTTYFFWNEDNIEPIAEVTTDSETGDIQGMSYKTVETRVSTGGPSLAQAQIKVYPNPATSRATFEVEGLQNGTYNLSLISILGKKIAERSFSPVAGQARISLDVSKLPSGMYLYSVRNSRGRTITTKRLQVR